MKLVSDTNSHILLAKTSALRRICEFNEWIVVETCYKEATKKQEFLDAKITQKLKKDNLIKVLQDPKETVEIQKSFNIGKGEASAIAFAKESKCVLVIEDTRARKVAEILNCKTTTAAAVVVNSVEKKIIPYEKGIEFINTASNNNWYRQEVIDLMKKDLEAVKNENTFNSSG